MNAQPAWGVDVTAVSVRAVKLEADERGQVRILAYDVTDSTAEVEDVRDLSRFVSMGRALFHFLNRHRPRDEAVWVSLRSEGAFTRLVNVPPVNDESLERLLEFEAQNQIPYPLDEVYWDRRVISIGEDGAILCSLYAIRRSLVSDRLRKLKKAGLTVDGIQLRAIALQNLCAMERWLGDGTVVIDVDYATLTVLLHHDDQTWFVSLPVGGVDHVAELRKTFDCDHRTALSIARGEHEAPDASLAKACASEVAQDLVDEVQARLRFYRAAVGDVDLSRAVLIRSHPASPPMKEALERTLGVRVGEPQALRTVQLAPAVQADEEAFSQHLGSLLKAIGLGLQGIGQAEVEVHLFPSDLQRERTTKRSAWGLALTALLAILALAGWHFAQEADALTGTVESAEQALLEASEPEGATEDKRFGEVLKRAESLREQLAATKGPRELTTTLLRRVTATQASEAPCWMVSLAHPGRDGTQGRLVLASALDDRGGDRAEALARLDAFAEALVGEGRLLAVEPQSDWTAGSLEASPPVAGSAPASRLRLVHRAFALRFGTPEGGS